MSTMPEVAGDLSASWILTELRLREQRARDEAMVAEVAWIARNPFPIVVTRSTATYEVEVRAGTTGRVKLGTVTDEALGRMDRRMMAPTLGKLARDSWRRPGAWPDPPPNVVLGDG